MYLLFLHIKRVCHQLIAVLVVGYSEALECYQCNNCKDDPTANPTDCSKTGMPNAAFCAKITLTDGDKKGQGKLN